MRMKVNSLQL